MSEPPEGLYCNPQTILVQQPPSADCCSPWQCPQGSKGIHLSVHAGWEQCSGCCAPRDSASPALLTFSHLFPSHTVYFGTTVSSQGTPWGHMENEISELICVKNKPEKKPQTFYQVVEKQLFQCPWHPQVGRWRGWNWPCCTEMAPGIPSSTGASC